MAKLSCSLSRSLIHLQRSTLCNGRSCRATVCEEGVFSVTGSVLGILQFTFHASLRKRAPKRMPGDHPDFRHSRGEQLTPPACRRKRRLRRRKAAPNLRLVAFLRARGEAAERLGMSQPAAYPSQDQQNNGSGGRSIVVSRQVGDDRTAPE